MDILFLQRSRPNNVCQKDRIKFANFCTTSFLFFLFFLLPLFFWGWKKSRKDNSIVVQKVAYLFLVIKLLVKWHFLQDTFHWRIQDLYTFLVVFASEILRLLIDREQKISIELGSVGKPVPFFHRVLSVLNSGSLKKGLAPGSCELF